jgi:outer membrane protein TolC
MQNLKNARIDEDNARIMEEKQLNDITAELKTAYNDFSWANKTLKLEQNNQLAHQEIVTITTARLQLGAINPIQLRDVQMRMLEAKHRMIDAKLQTVIAHLNISLLTGDFSNYSNPS